MPSFIFLVIFCWGVIVKPFSDTYPAAVIGVVAADGVGGLVSHLAFIFRHALGFRANGWCQNLPGCRSFKQSPECFKGLINLAPDLGGNTQDL